MSATIPATLVRELREKTGVGFMECKTALAEAQGDLERATTLLREKGLASASKKMGRTASDGLVVSYIHGGGKIGVLLELNCETDFVARTDEFGTLAKDLAMQVAATNPQYVRREEVPTELLEKERAILLAQVKSSGKPEKVIEQIVQGRLTKFFSEVCLQEQPFIKTPDVKVEDRIKEVIAKVGENVVVRRFCRYQLGEKVE
ncbi:elongation factor Ts [Candidatus Methylomirabilis lanthanidiphila]|uniref:Elongation factor Ts n=1 Tax=Candidatus Methylomirabilis lanthanidiphila TaxID=2211376 RepID=A0A564ZIW3_9BACT|nr:translation elongation factor Ts [Candidatus Methylomirabilis lanthanidiphila]VUZ85255.1 elongation factor Ts [Candidatus Methylomirabilis lanthanidiphila]